MSTPARAQQASLAAFSTTTPLEVRQCFWGFISEAAHPDKKRPAHDRALVLAK
ncbi:hypothetical protein SPB21_07595 [Leptothoe sp. ISB3NOV94-8A]